jgi:hypothetical protein
MMNKFDKPNDVTNADIAFGPKSIREFLPAYDSLPDDFKRMNNEYCDFVSNWFYSGLKSKPKSKDGIDLNKALGHLKTVLMSFEPKHEHKIAGAAWLASKWLVL